MLVLHRIPVDNTDDALVRIQLIHHASALYSRIT